MNILKISQENISILYLSVIGMIAFSLMLSIVQSNSSVMALEKNNILLGNSGSGNLGFFNSGYSNTGLGNLDTGGNGGWLFGNGGAGGAGGLIGFQSDDINDEVTLSSKNNGLIGPGTK
ncbi:MAG: hypothetical protein R2685_13760 [Candidatus Nitrosocosmicus sp.]|nr:hypothetical protein [Candidatus Nitrosocosmicus sp.]